MYKQQRRSIRILLSISSTFFWFTRLVNDIFHQVAGSLNLLTPIIASVLHDIHVYIVWLLFVLFRIETVVGSI